MLSLDLLLIIRRYDFHQPSFSRVGAIGSTGSDIHLLLLLCQWRSRYLRSTALTHLSVAIQQTHLPSGELPSGNVDMEPYVTKPRPEIDCFLEFVVRLRVDISLFLVVWLRHHRVRGSQGYGTSKERIRTQSRQPPLRDRLARGHGHCSTARYTRGKCARLA